MKLLLIIPMKKICQRTPIPVLQQILSDYECEACFKFDSLQFDLLSFDLLYYLVFKMDSIIMVNSYSLCNYYYYDAVLYLIKQIFYLLSSCCLDITLLYCVLFLIGLTFAVVIIMKLERLFSVCCKKFINIFDHYVGNFISLLDIDLKIVL